MSSSGSTSSTTTKKSKTKSSSSSSSFGFKRGFLNTNKSSSPSSRSSPPSSISRATTALSQLGLDTASTVPKEKTTAPASPLPPTVEKPKDPCPICYHALPLRLAHHRYNSCCGEMICLGCIIGQHRVLVVGTNVKLPLEGSQEEEREFELIRYSEEPMLCPFCRAEDPGDDEEERLKRLHTRINKYNDSKAMNLMGAWSMKGEQGLPQNLKKAEEYFKRSFDLGDIDVPHFLHHLYHVYIPDEVLRIKYLEEGTRRGNALCMHDLANHTLQSGNDLANRTLHPGNVEEAKRLYIMAARLGADIAMNSLTNLHRPLMVSKEDLATTRRAHKAVNDEVNNETIGYAMRYTEYLSTMRNAQ